MPIRINPTTGKAELIPREQTRDRVRVKRLPEERLWEVSGRGRSIKFATASAAYREVKRRQPNADIPDM